MSASVTIDGFPLVFRCHVYQPSDARPGVIVADSRVTDDQLISLPRVTNLTITAPGQFSGYWPDIKLVKVQRVRYGYSRLVFHDSRWKLAETRLDQNYNLRTSLGIVLTETKKTIAELVGILEDETGLEFSTGTLPSYEPGAAWADVPSSEALDLLLRHTGCRCVYNPVTAKYNITQGGTGPLPDLQQRIFRPGPPCQFRALQVDAAPTMHEARLPVKACTINRTTGALEDLPSPVHLATSPDDLEKQTILRLWRPTGTGSENYVLLPHRAKSHVFDPFHRVYERGRVIRDGWEPEPYHSQWMLPISTQLIDTLPWTNSGQVFVTDHPVLMTDSSGELLDSATLLTAYLEKNEFGSLIRESKERELNPAANAVLTETVDWIRPVDSSEPDMAGDVWDALHETVATAMASPYSADAQVAKLHTPQNYQGSGQIGAASYRLSSKINKPYVYAELAINFIPGSRGDID